ncbi:MAG: heavy metal translocating P-type ATPase, partial [Alphaproteobacteria bacterium]|nr:heavy metal translocating P-type ATPase [Alphaproteobacteria bacterium]
MAAVNEAALDPTAYVRPEGEGQARLDLLVENLHCPGCIRRIESTLDSAEGVVDARVNLSTRRLAIRFDPAVADAPGLVAAVADQGYRLIPFDPRALGAETRAEDKRLLVAMVVAGFAAANVMLLSVAVWAGANTPDMGPATRDLFHWLSGLIAVPAVAFAGRPFFASAVLALRGRRLNMDVPISLAVILATGVSLFETASGGEHAYFDAAVMLLFFLLVGRYLDRRARGQARSAVERMTLLDATAALVKDDGGTVKALPVERLRPGMTVVVAPGDRVPVDGVVRQGTASIDASLVSGESTPHEVAPGSAVHAGTLSLDGALEVRVEAAGEGTLLAEIVRLMAAAEQSRARYVKLADRAARIYAPAVHILALAAFLGWIALGNMVWQEALLTAVSVLIITCPCALGLAVPAVQIVASGILLRCGVIVTAGDALERLAEVDMAVFDKTGTLTLGEPRLVTPADSDPESLRIAAALAAASSHPLARALTRAAGPVAVVPEVRETPGLGLEAEIEGVVCRLGNRTWCAVDETVTSPGPGSELWLSRPNHDPVGFAFEDTPRVDAAALVAALTKRGLAVEMLSGDRPAVAAVLAEELSIERWQADMRPAEKVARLRELAEAGHKVLMVGDGLNDAPALAAAHVSAAPARAADISRVAADIILQGERLLPLRDAMGVARMARRLVLQNFGLAFAYNAVA